MGKLNQVIAVEKSVKNKAHAAITEIYQKMQKAPLLQGISRTYRPKDELGEALPSESSRVQLNATDFLKELSSTLTDLFDVTATKDFANCEARTDLTVGDVVLAKNVPVTYLLFLEKKLVDLHTFVSKLPVLDSSEEWTLDPNVNCYATKPSETTRTKKVFVPLVLAPATDKHAAQVKEGYEDQVVGFWKTVKFSGALPAQRVAELLARVEKLQRAVKFAREECNAREAPPVQVGARVFDYLFGLSATGLRKLKISLTLTERASKIVGSNPTPSTDSQSRSDSPQVMLGTNQ
jgi:hypothetical protein